MERLTASEASQRLQAGSLTVKDLCQALLDRVEARPEVQAWIHLDKKQVMSEAKKLDSLPQEQRGPLFGVPVAIKDLFYTKGTECRPLIVVRSLTQTVDMPTKFGSCSYADPSSKSDSAIVATLRSLGCLIMGEPVSAIATTAS